MLTFQSRFGNAEWLQPYTDKTVIALAESGVKNLAIVTPGFTADCLETLEEIAGENAEIFHHAGGKNFAAIPCLNDSEAGMAVIAHVVLRELEGLDRPLNPNAAPSRLIWALARAFPGHLAEGKRVAHILP